MHCLQSVWQRMHTPRKFYSWSSSGKLDIGIDYVNSEDIKYSTEVFFSVLAHVRDRWSQATWPSSGIHLTLNRATGHWD
jgi:hypothetical protein